MITGLGYQQSLIIMCDSYFSVRVTSTQTDRYYEVQQFNYKKGSEGDSAAEERDTSTLPGQRDYLTSLTNLSRKFVYKSRMAIG